MKRKILILVALLLSVGVILSPSFSDETITVQETAFLVAVADANAAALTVLTTSWAATAAWPEIPQKANCVKVKFYVYDPCGPDDKTFTYQLYIADYGCNAEIAASGSATCGKAEMSHNPITLGLLNSGAISTSYRWVDTLGTITSDLANAIYPQNDGGADEVASFIFDRQSAKKIWCRLYGRATTTMVVYCVAYYF
jgi:hypothetical protein